MPTAAEIDAAGSRGTMAGGGVLGGPLLLLFGVLWLSTSSATKSVLAG